MRAFTRTILVLVLVSLLVFLAGCAAYPKGPGQTVGANVRCWAVKRHDRCDYFQYLDHTGRVTAIGYDDDGDGIDEARIDLATVRSSDLCPHYVILLDGIPFDLVRRLYEQGHFRLFYPPTKLVTTFPSVTDLAYGQLFAPGEALGYQALWYDRRRGRLSGGALDYLAEKNASWQRLIDYRIAMILDPVGYVSPGFLFRTELRDIENTFNRRREGTVIGYSVGTAAVGTRKGSPGFIKCLKRVEQLCEKLVYQRRGRCQITLLADHGHNLTESTYFDIAEALKQAGFNPTDKLKKPNDLVCIQFGLLTYNAIYTTQPGKVADTLLKLLKNEQVELAIYPGARADTKSIIVRSRHARAVVTGTDRGYTYKIEKGDPLKLKSIVESLRSVGAVTDDGVIDDQRLFQATVDHEYPDPLARIYLAFNGLVKHPADLIVTVKDGWFCGAKYQARSIDVASTHGSLNRANSVTFVMTTIKPLGPAVRMADLTDRLAEMVPHKSRNN